ncbi:DEAD-domain-containing protein [Eremomyces bilateralis CBS 781.70]|uniref:ATP-dependent RNA helicase n=1 Tax=Eremomyces bilateralis CBS 781.70 TaxID=1392243 RepID=A0A6G1G6R1_9PEZI|nr:DEAD-domain-containing protein [Eremomyces bilateralis CBS 781.70]KAF1813775.1 DEAD-domain-containing protein [Eremomyces bilateralis CBS 781.70]
MHRALSRCQSAGITSALLRNVRVARIAGLQRVAAAPSTAFIPSASRFLHIQQSLRQTAEATRSHEPSVDYHGPISRFEELGERGMAHPAIVQALTKQMGLENMTDVQAATVGKALSGIDMAAQARTGTGKTLAFLVPILHRIIEENPALAARSSHSPLASMDDSRALVISPTRELAEQIAAEARRLTANTNVIVQVAVGGSNKRAALQEMRRRGCHILVATPGRLTDLLSDEYSGVKLSKLNTLVLDEADRLLDDGFWPEIMRIERFLPQRKERPRQTLLFSATMPREVLQLSRQLLQPKHEFIQTVNEDEAPTHERVPQKLVRVDGYQNLMPALYELLLQGNEAAKNGGRPLKAIVFFNTTAEVELGFSIFRNLRPKDGRSPLAPARLFEIHSKLSQFQRTAASEGFRKVESGIMFSSDVSARGMDFPNVTHVIQVRCPRSTDTYIHRVGRTGRAGREGESWVITPKTDTAIRGTLKGLPVKADNSLGTATLDMKQPAELPKLQAMILNEIGEASRFVGMTQKSSVYTVLMNISLDNSRDMEAGVQEIVDLSKYGWGLRYPPALSRFVLGKLPRGIDVSTVSGPATPRESDDRSSFQDRRGGSRGGFGGRDGGSRGGFQDRNSGSRGGFRDRDGGSRGGFQDRGSGSRGGFRDRDGGSRGGFQDRGSRDFGSAYGSRSNDASGGFSRGGDAGERGSFPPRNNDRGAYPPRSDRRSDGGQGRGRDGSSGGSRRYESGGLF